MDEKINPAEHQTEERQNVYSLLVVVGFCAVIGLLLSLGVSPDTPGSAVRGAVIGAVVGLVLYTVSLIIRRE